MSAAPRRRGVRGIAGRVRRKALALAAAVAGIVAAAVPGTAAAELGQAPSVLSDGAEGLSCEYYVSIANLRWQRRGGDWSDAAGEPYGNKPFASQELQRFMAPGGIALDLTALARKWREGGVVPGAVMLRALKGEGIADIVSRESEQVLQRPALLVTWDDGRRELLDPVADSYTACPTLGSLGTQPMVRAGGPNVALLSFPLPNRAGHKPANVSLRLATLRVWGPMVVGAFAVQTPALAPVPVSKGLADRVRGDVGLEQQADVLHVERFERNDWAAQWRPGGPEQTFGLVGGEAGFEPLQRNALKVTVEGGRFVGMDLQRPLKALAGGTEPEELYLRYYLRLGGDWDPSNVGKLPGLAGTYGRGGWGGRTTDGYNGWSARGAFYAHDAADSVFGQRRGIGNYLYHVDAKRGGYGEMGGWERGPTGLLEKNRWYCIEHYVKLNKPGERNGVVRGWVDGQLSYERTDLLFRMTPELRIETVWMDVYHGGRTPAPHRLTLYLDNLVVARRYIGPMKQ